MSMVASECKSQGRWSARPCPATRTRRSKFGHVPGRGGLSRSFVSHSSWLTHVGQFWLEPGPLSSWTGSIRSERLKEATSDRIHGMTDVLEVPFLVTPLTWRRSPYRFCHTALYFPQISGDATGKSGCASGEAHNRRIPRSRPPAGEATL
jgi:hypothetical protein